MMPASDTFIEALPKAELHVHLEGTLEPGLKIILARRNGHPLQDATEDDIRAGYGFHDLPSFLALYYEGVELLHTEQDFYDLCHAYLKKAASQNVLYSEMFFDPQLHTRRGIAFETVISGLNRARKDAQRDFGIRSQLVMCFIREMSAQSAEETFTQALPHLSDIVGVGLDSDEKGNPPAKFANVFKRARDAGLHVTMHCDIDQENTHEHIRQALEDLGSERLDHGLNILEKPDLLRQARERHIPFTVCPFPNMAIRPNSNEKDIRALLDAGLTITINSDDPGYMQGVYMTEAMKMARDGAHLTPDELLAISRNAFRAAWIGEKERRIYLDRLDDFARKAGMMVPAI
ncbi:adenosine deaminase [Komagataeibacter intermedius]|uniref:Adenine deaminase n=2 Tax=Komagataeibacter intermedius TaxID=66229 RepID=A0A0N1FAM3_9PROT|nr:adenosine deaminase [Komagataeibacter intermedius]KPH88159.1 adenine deaminase [Komagataeibacter intermedius AF2]MCF3635910.1 adenosine deaminase [Komagataeibacter intermedius]GAN86437.1 deaminase [Komagataeibacter intermedius TF2]GBQ68249.1 adenosine deaminase [Komagataeibacter intermedius NRIC 0521]